MRFFENVGRLAVTSGLVLFGACSDGGDAQVQEVADTSFSDVDTESDSTEDIVRSECTFATLPSAPTTEPASVRFSLNRDTVLDRHLFIPTPEDLEKGGYGGGGALIDYNDDGLVDVLLARRAPEGSPTCLYENTSSTTTTTFRKAACFQISEKRVGPGSVTSTATRRKSCLSTVTTTSTCLMGQT